MANENEWKHYRGFFRVSWSPTNPIKSHISWKKKTMGKKLGNILADGRKIIVTARTKVWYENALKIGAFRLQFSYRYVRVTCPSEKNSCNFLHYMSWPSITSHNPWKKQLGLTFENVSLLVLFFLFLFKSFMKTARKKEINQMIKFN